MVVEGSGKVTTASIAADEEVRAKKLGNILLSWFHGNGRSFPWRSTQDPYRILVAEVCLQKTNAAKVVPIFEIIVEKYPDIESLAAADATDLRDYFSGLGLFKRASFLLQIARAIVDRYAGIVPRDRQSLLKVKGVGDYTANSVLCLAYGDPLPLLDGSTQRVLGRVFNRQTDKPAWANKSMRDFMQAILPHNGAREFNLALIDIADKYCRPKKPECGDCPVREACLTAIEIGGL
jgi:A/G-specific adenine glycosylase